MISVCIPVYNLGVAELVDTLYQQSLKLDADVEIILIDDCSDDSFTKQNKQIDAEVTHIQLEKNIGRAAIRNRFLEYAGYDHLLFLDCDTTIEHSDFLHNWVAAIKKHPDCVICGGSEYDKKAPPKSKRLRWKYGIKRESKSIEARVKGNYDSFLTNNFIISRQLFETVQFDENLVKYGHEDTLFGIELKKAGIKILHIDNTVLNGNLSNNTDFIKHTEQAIENLIFLLENSNHSDEIRKNISLLRTHCQLHKIRGIIVPLFFLLGPLIKNMLSKGFVNLYLFDFYKLGFLNNKLDT